jgi:hypothetical protein
VAGVVVIRNCQFRGTQEIAMNSDEEQREQPSP